MQHECIASCAPGRMGRERVVMKPDFLILMLAGNGRALKDVFRDCDHVFRPICLKFGGYMNMV